MPVQRFSSSPVDRPPGLVPPHVELSGLTEVRVHGVGGAGPEALLGDVAPQQVAGDRLAGFYRTADTYGADGRPRHVEAYSWGGLTSRSGARVLWLLLLPFTLANLAGWMCAPGVHASGWRFRLHRTTVRWAALGLTVNLVLLIAITTMDLIGYQCGGLASCATGRWWLGPLGSGVFTGFPARRVLVGALFPLLLVAGLGLLTLVAVRRYEDVEPPARGGLPVRGRGGAAQPRLGLADQAFWDGRGCVLDLGLLHLAAPVAAVALLVTHTVRTSIAASGAVLGVPLAARHSWLAAAALALGALALVAVVALLALDTIREGVCFAVFCAAIAAVLAALAFAAAQPGFAQAAGPLPGMRAGAAAAFGVFILSLLLVLATAALARRAPGGFWIAAPFVALTCGYVLLNVVVLGVLIRLADVLSRVTFAEAAVTMAAGGTRLFVDEVVGWAVPYLTLAPLALIAAFTAYQLLRYWLAGRDAGHVAEIEAGYRTHPRPDTEPDWQVNALDGDGFAPRIARTRRLAVAPHDVDKLLTAIAVAGLVVLALGWIRVWAGDVVPGLPGWILTTGTWIATALPVVVVLVLRRGWRNVASRRHLGVLWDVGTFWPRAYHPLAPPSYAERAVPELQRRIWRIHDNGGRVVLAAHSQGTVLAAAALLQADARPPGAAIGLLTFGSPLRKLYGWGFPAYFSGAVLRRLVDPGSPAVLRGWRNDHYRTDFIGGPVLAAPGEGAARVDRELPDPPTSWHIFGQPAPRPGGHFGYWTDAAVWTGAETLADPSGRSERLTGQPLRGH